MITPYYSGENAQLFLGDCREVLPTLGISPASCVCDPPYGTSAAVWDRWPAGWVNSVSAALPPSASLWCFGSARMFLTHRDDFAAWKFAQEALWVKRNGTGPTSRDRLATIHEWAYHWRRGPWTTLHHEWERVPYDGPDKHTTRRTAQTPHQGKHLSSTYTDDGTRQPRSVTFVIEAPSVRYQKRHQDEKPLAVVIPLVRECTPPGELVLDCFAGSGTTGVAARILGRRAVLIEADEAMCETAALRLSDPQGSLFENVS
ncbi:MAG: DNA-methyltransferase [Pseudonocardiaceae bacterium]